MVIAPSNWVEITSPRPAEPTPADPYCSHSHSHSQNTWAHTRGSLMAAHSRDQPAATKKGDEPATLPWEVMTQLEVSEHRSSCPLPGFVEITMSLWGDHSLWIVTGIPPEEAEESYEAVSSSIMATHLFQHATLDEMFIDILTCMMSFMDLGSTLWWSTPSPSSVGAFWFRSTTHPTVWQLFALQLCWTVSHLECLPWCFDLHKSHCWQLFYCSEVK